MTEKQVEDVTKGRDLSTSIDELEHLREQVRMLESALGQWQQDEEWKEKELCDLRVCIKELEGANYRLNKRVREQDYALKQCEEDKALAETQRDGARSWARNLLGRAENLDWLVERIGASWREDVAELKKELDEVKNGEIYEDELEHHCGQCGRMLEIVRPGKWQCPDCE